MAAEVMPTLDPPVRRVLVATDRSERAERAVRWAAFLAERNNADLLLVQVVVPRSEPGTELAGTDATMVHLAERDLTAHARALAGPRGHARVILDEDPATALLSAAREEHVDTLVVGNAGMSGRKEFLLGNIPNRISHNAQCNVIIINTRDEVATTPVELDRTEAESRLAARAAHVGAAVVRHGLEEVFRRHRGAGTQQDQARHLRLALEELGPTYAKLGQILSTRPDLLPPPFIEELCKLQDDVPPIPRAEVVAVMEEELGVPWEDVFESIDPDPLAAGTIAQVHRATLEDGDRVVVKVQRPTARAEIMDDLALFELFVEKTRNRPLFTKIVDMSAVFEHLSDSLQRELDFTQEASNIRRISEVLEDYPRLDAPGVYDGLSTSRLLVLEEIPGTAVSEAPEGAARKEAGRQLLECYYRQILSEGFFHADPHPGNLMWHDDRLFFLDFGMVGEIGPDLRRSLMLLLMAFWQEDVGFLMDVTLLLSGDSLRSDLDVDSFRGELGDLMSRYRNVPMAEIELGAILQEMTEISIRHEVPLPASLTLTAKAMAQVQLTAVELDPELDPFEVAGAYLMRTMTAGIREKIDPKWLFYESQKLGLRITRLIEAFERLTGARPGPRLQVNFRAEQLENIVQRSTRRLAIGATASAALLGASRMASSGRVNQRVPLAVGALGAGLALRLLYDVVRGR